jgi:hypothetical protein
MVRGRSSLCRIRMKWCSAEYLFPREIEAVQRDELDSMGSLFSVESGANVSR